MPRLNDSNLNLSRHCPFKEGVTLSLQHTADQGAFPRWAAALDEAKRWLRNLSGEEATKIAAAISHGIARGTRGKNVELNVKPDAKVPAKESKPFAHPMYWAAFILIGDPN